MADADLCHKLLQKGADPTKAYYRTHPWKDGIWQPSSNLLERVRRVDEKLISEHLEFRQLQAYFWDNPEKFFAMRHYNPQAKICDELLHHAPAPTILSKTPQPITTTPYSFFEDKLSSDRLVRELDTADAVSIRAALAPTTGFVGTC